MRTAKSSHRTQPEPLTDIELCYVAALVEGLRLIDEKARELGIEAEMDPNALMMFVVKKGDCIRSLVMGG